MPTSRTAEFTVLLIVVSVAVDMGLFFSGILSFGGDDGDDSASYDKNVAVVIPSSPLRQSAMSSAQPITRAHLG